MIEGPQPHFQQPPLPDGLDRAWRLALDDAGLAADEVYLHVTELPMGDGVLAKHLRRCLNVDSGLSPEVDAELNADPLVRFDRVLIRLAGRPIEIDAALLRHELEHVRQTRAEPKLVDLHHTTSCVVDCAGEESASLYTQIPMEVRANGAAAGFARRQYGNTRIDALVDSMPHVALLSTASPGPPVRTVEDEMIAFLAEHAGLCRRFKFFRFAVGERVYAEWLRRVSVA